MRWEDMRSSENIDDRTRGGGMRSRGMRLGLGGIVIVVILSLIFGVDPMQFLGMVDSGGPTMQAPRPQQQPGGGTTLAPTDPAKQFTARVLGDTEDVWTALFKAMARQPYEKPVLTLFPGRVQSACGLSSAASGPFYCPADRRLYLDTSFYQELARRFGAPGDFAQAYVIAHEVGHHVQNLFGTMGQFQRQAARLDERARNALSIRLELQADCYAGVWGHFAKARNLLEPGDLEEGLRAAGAVGDDTIMKRTQGYVVPDAMNHGTAAQRMAWFRRGLETGDPRQCDTFANRTP